MNLENIISNLHWEQGKSLNLLSKECGVTRQSFTNACKKQGLKTRGVREATKLTKNKGSAHYQFGKSNPKQAKRMRENNPALIKEYLQRATDKKSETYKKYPWPQEIKMMRILDKRKITYIFQFPACPYILDFYLPEKSICIEVDSTDKWGKDRKLKAKERDSFLLGKGISVFRINKKYLDNPIKVESFFSKIFP